MLITTTRGLKQIPRKWGEGGEQDR